MMRLSFVKGKGNLNHNNRKFVSKNVDRSRSSENIVYRQIDLKAAYDVLFGDAIEEYNKGKKPSKQPYKNSDDYLERMTHSKMNQKPFYENLVQIGTMHDTGCGSRNATIASVILEKYALTFPERNPNLYLFNAVLHMDEATPHLHLDYIPVKHSKRGISVQNSLTGALSEMGFSGHSKEKNSTMEWQKREREYIRQLCRKAGITLEEEKSTDRDSLTPEEYRIAAEISEKRVEQVMISEKPVLHKKFGVVTNYSEVVEHLQKQNSELRVYKEQHQEITKNITEEVNIKVRKELSKGQRVISQKKEELDDQAKQLEEKERQIKTKEALMKEQYDAVYAAKEIRMYKEFTESKNRLEEKSKEVKSYEQELFEKEKILVEREKKAESYEIQIQDRICSLEAALERERGRSEIFRNALHETLSYLSENLKQQIIEKFKLLENGLIQVRNRKKSR